MDAHLKKEVVLWILLIYDFILALSDFIWLLVQKTKTKKIQKPDAKI